MYLGILFPPNNLQMKRVTKKTETVIKKKLNSRCNKSRPIGKVIVIHGNCN